MLDPCFMDWMFRNLTNDEFFESEWIMECNDSLVEAIEKYMASKMPDSIGSPLSMRLKMDNIPFSLMKTSLEPPPPILIPLLKKVGKRNFYAISNLHNAITIKILLTGGSTMATFIQGSLL